MFRFTINFIYIVLLLCCISVMKNNLRANICNWRSTGASETVFDSIQNGIKFPLMREVGDFEINNGRFSFKEEEFLKTEISNLLLLGCIDVAAHKSKCVSPISCVPKKNGKFRLVTDLRHLNSYSQPPKVKYEDINTVIKVVKPKDFMVTADLQNGFFRVPFFHEDYKTLLGFKFKLTYYTWSVLPFGHNW